MKNIEDIIRNNKEFFEAAEPSEGHFERFSRKLGIKVRRKNLKKKYCSISSEGSSCYTARNSVITVDMGSFHQIRQEQDDSWRCLSSIQGG